MTTNTRARRKRRPPKVQAPQYTDEQKFIANRKAESFGAPLPFPEASGYKNTRVSDIVSSLSTAKPPITPELTLEDIQAHMCLPQTLGMPREIEEQEHERFRATFDHAGAFSQMHNTLSQHLSELGQFPMGGFMGYGMLQNLAQNPAISRAISVVADEITKNWIEIKGGDKDDNERVKELTELVTSRYNLQALFRAAIRKVGFYGGAFIFIDTGEREDLALPLPVSEHSTELVKGGRLSFRVIDPVTVSPCDYNSTRPLEPDYMKPRSWWVYGEEVHASRLLTLYDDEPPELLKPAYNFLGIPLAQKLADSVAHWNQSRVLANEALNKVNLLVLKTSVDEALSCAGGVQVMDTRMEWLMRNRNANSVFLCDMQTEDVQNVQNTIAGIAEIVKMNREDFAAAVGVPGVKLFGLSPGGFNATGESDLKSFYDHVRSQQEIYRPQLQRCLNAIQLVHFGEIDPTITFDFVEVSADNGTSAAMNAQTKITGLSTAVQAGIISAEEGREYLRRDQELNMSWLDEEPPEPANGMGDMDEMDLDEPNEQAPLPQPRPIERPPKKDPPDNSTNELLQQNKTYLESLMQQGGS